MIYTSLLCQPDAMTDGLRRDSERRIARVAARWHRRLRRQEQGGAERVGVEPTRA